MMTPLRKKITQLVSKAFVEMGYDEFYGEITVSDRPDLSQFQCNGAFAVAKKAKSNPNLIAKSIVEKIISYESARGVFKKIDIAGAGFINFILEDSYLAQNVNEMARDEKSGVSQADVKVKIIIDYGGPNVGKPLHVGHLRSAIIGESLKRIAKFIGHEVISDVHLGDWGLQMGMIITELKRNNPDWVYFDENYKGEYPKESPIQFSDFESTYPEASRRAKENEDVMQEARAATVKLQDKLPGYIALWKHFIDISVADLKKSYDTLFVDFDLWNGESDVQEYISPMIEKLKEDGYAYESEGALVVDVVNSDDDHEVPPFMVCKTDGSALYSTTDLVTIDRRMKDYNPQEIWYVVDMRQAMHFKQVFRCSYKTNIVSPDVILLHLGFGTMNGVDGKPFKTRDGGVMKLNDLIAMVLENAYKRIEEEKIGSDFDDDEKEKIAHFAGVAALKFADLMNYRSKDYVFDPDKFSSFEGKTGTYLLYATVRIKSILRKAKDMGFAIGEVLPSQSDCERELHLNVSLLNDAIAKTYYEKAPNNICEYVYNLSSVFNKFYHEHRILIEEDEALRGSWLGLLNYTHDVMSLCLDLLGIKVPERL